MVPLRCSSLPAPQDGGSEQLDAMLALAKLLTAGASTAFTRRLKVSYMTKAASKLWTH